MKNIFKIPQFENLNFYANRGRIPSLILSEAKKKKQIVHGARAMNIQLPLFFQRPTEDFDVYTKNPKQTANKIQKILDIEIAEGKDEFYSKRARHRGTYKVLHEGDDKKKRTKDDIVIADYTGIKEDIPFTNIEGVRYETLSSIRKHREKALKNPKAKFRREKDTEDIERIEISKIMRGKL